MEHEFDLDHRLHTAVSTELMPRGQVLETENNLKPAGLGPDYDRDNPVNTGRPESEGVSYGIGKGRQAAPRYPWQARS